MDGLTGDLADQVRNTTCSRVEAGLAAFQWGQATTRHAQLNAAKLLWRPEGRRLVPIETGV
tara:strand:+ start:384 stop:566 length:183 start_codon:yes stop_codon:yes gene_type:complete